MTLDKLLIQVRRIAEHRQLGAEKQIRAAYKRTLNDLKKFIGYEFAQYAEDGKLTYDILAKKQSTARFLEEVQQNIDGLSPETQAEILQCVSDIYGLSYEGMTNAALKTAPKVAAVALQGLSFVQPTQVISSVNNELINKITLNDVLEKNRRNVIYDLKQAVTIGITNGETVDMMSRRVSGVLDGDYKKAVRVVRTEAHRVREMGLSDSAKSFDEELQKTDTGLRMVKIWRTMKDDRVRPNRRYKTKKGWRTSVGSGANHQKMEGQTVLATDMFELTEDLAQPISAYSHGMKQKLAIISALVHEPKLIIMDEPFVGLDPKASHFLKTTMRELCESGTAIFFSTHVLEVAEKLCDKIAIIKDGKLIKSGTMDEVRGDASLEDVFLELEDVQ